MKGDMRDRLAELQIDKVAVQKDIPAKQLGDDEISGDMRSQLRRGLVEIPDRWGSGRTEESYQKKERPLLDSDEWRAIEAGCDATRRSRSTMELVGSFESIPSATTGDGYH